MSPSHNTNTESAWNLFHTNAYIYSEKATFSRVRHDDFHDEVQTEIIIIIVFIYWVWFLHIKQACMVCSIKSTILTLYLGTFHSFNSWANHIIFITAIFLKGNVLLFYQLEMSLKWCQYIKLGICPGSRAPFQTKLMKDLLYLIVSGNFRSI